MGSLFDIRTDDDGGGGDDGLPLVVVGGALFLLDGESLNCMGGGFLLVGARPLLEGRRGAGERDLESEYDE